jgi:gentisate 1,2-dioxygenase
MALGTPTYGSSILNHLGITNIFDGEGSYPAVDLEEVALRAPDVILAPSEPYPFAVRHVAELEKVAPTMLIDGQDLFWWGVRTLEALMRLERNLETL